MGLPSFNIIFTEAASSFISRAQKGVLAVILKDSAVAAQGEHVLTSLLAIPAMLSLANRTYLAQAFTGAESRPSRILCYVLPAEPDDFTEALEWLAGQQFNWLVGPPDLDEAGCDELIAWIKGQRENGRLYKAVLPFAEANNKAIVNFATEDIIVGSEAYLTSEFCARIAGLIAGTPLSSSVTYAVLPEVTGVTALSRAEMDAAIDAGQLILLHDGRKVKVGRGVTSLVTPAAGDSKQYKKIKIVEALDLIVEDIRTLGEDNYIGKYANSYDNRLLLITAIKSYFLTLEGENVLKRGYSSVDIDSAANEAWLKAAGVDTSEMTEQEIREADTGDAVFLVATIRVLDAIEDVALTITI